MISDQLKLINAIAPTPHPRVELPQIQNQEASLGIHLEMNDFDSIKIKTNNQTTVSEVNEVNVCTNSRSPKKDRKTNISLLETITAATTATLLLSNPGQVSACDTLYLQTDDM